MFAESVCADAPDVVLVSRFCRSRCHIAYHLLASFFDHPFRRLYPRHEHAADLAVVIRNRAVRKCEVALFEVVVPVQRDQLIGKSAVGLTLPHDPVVQRSGVFPRFGKYVLRPAAQGRGVFCSKQYPLRVVVQERVVWPPADRHRIP
jgi:hypothetical protein